MIILLYVLIFIFVFIIGIVAFVAFYIIRQGDCDINLYKDSLKTISKREENNKIFIVAEIPFVNSGTQDGTIVDVNIYTVKKDDDLHISIRKWRVEENPRDDNYWVAYILKKKSSCLIGMEVAIIPKEKVELEEMQIKIVYTIVGRSYLYDKEEILNIPLKKI